MIYLMTKQEHAQPLQYDRVLMSLRQLGVTSSPALNAYLFDKISGCDSDFWKADEQNQYVLLNFCWKLAGNSEKKYDITEKMILKLESLLKAEPVDCTELQDFWKNFRMYAPPELEKLVLDNIFESNESIQEYHLKLKNQTVPAVELLFSVFYEMLKNNRMLTFELTEDAEKYCFLLRLLVMSAQNKTALEHIFSQLKCSELLMYRIIMDGAKILHNTAGGELLMTWWDCALDADGCEMSELCQKLRTDTRMTPELTEQLIINRILRSGTCPPELMQILLKNKQEDDTGKSIFCEWIAYSRKKQNFQEFVSMILYIRKFRFPAEIQKDLLMQTDMALLCSENAGYECLTELEAWAKSIHCLSQDAVLLRAKNQIAMKNISEKEFCQTLCHVAKAHTPFFKEFLNWELFSDIMQKALKYRSPDIYIALIMLFDFEETNAETKKYCRHCLRKIIENGRTRSQQLVMMLDICELYTTSVKTVSGYQEEQVIEAQHLIKKAFASLLPEYYKAGMEDTLKRLSKEDTLAKAELLSVIHKKIPESQNKKKTFLSIFNKNK